MIFEGSEKKAEIIVKSSINLLEMEDRFWHSLVENAKATVLSSVKNEFVKAYLLSESSLFVWSDRILIITCGQTTLINAINFFVTEIGRKNIDQLIFQRKNEYFSHLQPTSFTDDIELLEKEFSGDAYRFGMMDDHHNFIYFTEKEYVPNQGDHTYELLMYELSKEASSFLMKEDLSVSEVRKFLKLDKILPDFQIDDFNFDPYGYSLNAISGDNYFTIHITPQEQSPYVSFETDINLNDHLETILTVFSPGSFDFIEFVPRDENQNDKKINNYQLKSNVSEFLRCGYTMNFSHFFKQRETKLSPYKIL